jgi:putative peptidoglycan lipid II flippase
MHRNFVGSDLISQIAAWRSRLRSVHPDHLRIAKGAVWVSVFVLFGKCAAALREMAIAYHYGISPVVAAYQFTFTLITWLPADCIAVLQVALVPALVELRGGPKEAMTRFLGELQMVAVAIGVACAGALLFVWPFVLGLLAHNLSDEARALSRTMLAVMLPVDILMLMICAYSARLQARERHVNTLLDCMPAAAVLLFLLAWPHGGAPAPLMWGTTIGFLLQAVCAGVLAGATDGAPNRVYFSLRSPQWSRHYRAVGMFMFGQLALSLAVPLDQYFIASLGDGAVATYAYSGRLISLLEGMGAVAIGRATLPVFSDILGAGEVIRARQMALKWSFMMLAIGMVAIAIVWPLAPLLIRLIFQHGAFTDADTLAVARLLRWNLPKLPFYFAQLVLMQLFAGEGRFSALAVVAVAGFVVKVAANLALIGPFGVEGIVLATGISTAAAFGLNLLLMKPGRRGGTTAARVS